MRILRTLALVVLASMVWSAMPAFAQPIGTYRWQLQPYCNVITVAVVQQGGQYQLHGTDDQCGAAVQASVVGLAFQNLNGTIGFGLTIVTAPGGTSVAVDATITIATLGGTWRDSAGNSGTFIFTPGAGVGGGPRPVPSGGIAPGSVTNIQIANNAVTSVNVVDGSLTTADLLGAPKAAFASGDQSVTLTAVAAVMRSVTLTIPTSGTVLVNTGGYFKFNSAAQDAPRCSITTATFVDFNHLIIADDSGFIASTAFVPFGQTRGFTVTAGTFTVNLVCELAAGAVDVRDSSLTATFVGS